MSSIITRCYSPKHKCYHNYGGRGIKVCDEWIGNGGLDNFYNWAISAGFTGEKMKKDTMSSRLIELITVKDIVQRIADGQQNLNKQIIQKQI